MIKTFNLPCDFGETLYWKDEINFRVVPISVTSFTFSKSSFRVEGYEMTYRGMKMHKGIWGVSIFLTKEDAKNQNLYKYNIGDCVQTTLLPSGEPIIGTVLDRNYNIYGDVSYNLKTDSGIKLFWEDENGKANLI
jgi:hypothetical protein